MESEQSEFDLDTISGAEEYPTEADQLKHGHDDQNSLDASDNYVSDDSQEETSVDGKEYKNVMRDIGAQLEKSGYLTKLDVDKKEQEHFLKQYGKYLIMAPPDRAEYADNILHCMVSNNHSSRWLVKHVITKRPERMHDLDNAERPALALAVCLKRSDFINAVLESGYNDLDPILSRTSTEGNCIHSAIIKGLGPEITIKLIEGSSEATLSAQNKDGLTPLHHAVDYNRCTAAAAIGVVKALLEHGNAALDKETKGGLSPYRYHFATRRARIAQDSEAQDHNPRYQDNRYQSSQITVKTLKDGADISKKKTHTDGRQQTQKKPAQGMNATNSQMKKKTKARKDAVYTATQNPPPSVDGEIADKIERELKLHYLRSLFKLNSSIDSGERNDVSAVRFLRDEQQEEKHLFFDLREGKSNIRKDLFEEGGSYENFKFDSALQYVAVRRLCIGPAPSARQAEGSGKSRQDMVYLFKWLHRKSVRNIVYTLIEDLEPPSHSEEAIQTTLERFEIDILDWRRVDICPETIFKGCKWVRQLHLWWSGLGGMLVAWSGENGLARLPQLKDIFLHQTQYLESSKWTEIQLDQFASQITKTRRQINIDRKNRNLFEFPDINIHRPEYTDITLQRSPDNKVKGNEGPAVKCHEWLTTMDTFADGLWTLKYDDILSKEDLPPVLKRGVRVCLIDDGVDIEQEFLKDNMETGGQSFDQGHGSSGISGVKRAHYHSSTDHGTLMANMIRRVCPNVKICSYRLHVLERFNTNRPHFTCQSAAEAVEFASTQNFDIISMSWTIQQAEDNKSHLGRLENALKTAAGHGALLFCAAPDSGSMSQKQFQDYYPFGCSDVPIFRIGAATADGSDWSWAGGPKHLDYVVPGHEVTDRDTARVKENTPRTGSSIATALAAGLAALIIECVRMAALHSHSQAGGLDYTTISHFEQIKKRKAINKIFERMVGKDPRVANYVNVHDIFHDPGEKLANIESRQPNLTMNDSENKGLPLKEREDRVNNQKQKEKWAIVTDLARDLRTAF